MMKKCLITLCMLLVFTGCTDSKYNKGAWENMMFTSDYFHFRITFDETIYHQYDIKEIAQVLGKTVIELTEDESIADMYEFMVAPDNDTPLFQFYVEQYTFTPMMTFDDFIVEFTNQMRQQEDITYAVGNVQTVNYQGVEVRYIPVNADAGYFTLHQDIYMFKEGSYVGTLMITYTDGYEQMVQDVLQTIEPIN